MSRRLYINEDTSGLIRGFTFPERLTTLSGLQDGIEIKRGDSQDLLIQWGKAFGTARQLVTPTVIKFGAKVPTALDGSYVVSNFDAVSGEYAFTVSGTGATATYRVAPSWNTLKLNNLLGYDPEGFAEQIEIRCIPDRAGSLDQKAFILRDSAGSVGVWIGLNGFGAAPASVASCARRIAVMSIATGDSAATVATKLAAVLNADSAFIATAEGKTVRVTDAIVGAREIAADVNTGFSFTRWIVGAAPGTMTNLPYFDLAGEIEVSEDGVVSSSATFPVRVMFDVNNGGSAVAAIADPDYPAITQIPRFLPTVTGLTGGTASDLDAVVTAGRAPGVVCFNLSGSIVFYQLSAGTLATSSPSVIRPLDYDAETNAVVWRRRSSTGGEELDPVNQEWGDLLGIPSAVADLAGGSYLGAASINTVGTILSGGWEGSSIAGNYLELAITSAYGNTSVLSEFPTVFAALVTEVDAKADLVDGKVPSSQLPSFVDDVLEYATLAGFPATGETGKIYVATGTGVTYRWSGSAYVEISASLALGETSSTAYRGDRGKTAYDHAQVTGNPHGTSKTDIGLPNVTNDAQLKVADLVTSVREVASASDTKISSEKAVATALAAVGGGGSALVRGAGVLTGYTDPGASATPASATITFSGISAGQGGSIAITVDGATLVFFFYSSEPTPETGMVWVDSSSLADPSAFASALAYALGSSLFGSTSVTASAASETVTVSTSTTGAGATLAFDLPAETPSEGPNWGSSQVAFSGAPATGTNAGAPSGNIDDVELIPAVEGKTIKLVSARVTGNLPTGMQLAFWDGSSFTACSEVLSPTGAWATLNPDDNGGGSSASAWHTGVAGASLVARIIAPAGTQVSAPARIEVIAEQS